MYGDERLGLTEARKLSGHLGQSWHFGEDPVVRLLLEKLLDLVTELNGADEGKVFRILCI